MSQLKIENLKLKHIGPVDLVIEHDERVVISGASGSGKSLLLRAIVDVIPHQGECYLDEVPCSRTNPATWRRQVGLLPAESQWWYDHVSPHFNDKPDLSLFERLGFNIDVMQWQLARCSTGEKQRLSLLRLLANQPRCLLLDEPTASLDESNTRDVESMLLDYQQQHQAPLIWVSHNATQIKRIATRVLLLKDGSLVEERL